MLWQAECAAPATATATKTTLTAFEAQVMVGCKYQIHTQEHAFELPKEGKIALAGGKRGQQNENLINRFVFV